MTPTLVQINFTTDIPRASYAEAVAPAAETIAAQPGLRWKTWIFNEQTQEAGGIYLFEDAEAAQAYIDGPIVAKLAANPDVRTLSIRTFEVLTGLTARTRGPVPRLA